MTDPRLDPDIARFVCRLRQDWSQYPVLDTVTTHEARAIAERVRAPWAAGGPVMAETREVTAGALGSELRLRIHRPVGLAKGPAPALLYLHGGGFVFFSINSHDRLMREYAEAAGTVVVGVDYPLAPEARYPVALDQIVKLVRWLKVHGKALGLDYRRLALGGDSAGANLALASALRLRDAGEGERVSALLLVYGAFSDHVSDAAEAAFGGADALLTRAEMRSYFANYLRGPVDVNDPYACPLIAADLSALPPAFFVVPELDVLRAQSEIVAERMAAAGGEAVSVRYHGATHSFLEAVSIATIARTAIDDSARWLRAVLAGG